MEAKNNARPSLQARRAVAEQRNNFSKVVAAVIAGTVSLYFLGTFGMYWFLQFIGRLP